MSKSALHLLIACGGTGGHLFPGIAIAQQLKKEGHKVSLLISEKQVDSLASSAYGDLDFIKVPAIAMPRIYSPKMIFFFKKMWETIQQCRKIIRESDADVVLGMGGFTSLPPILAAHYMKKPAFVHESNALPGKANRLTARWCKKILLGVGDAAPYFYDKAKTVVTGTPVRLELMQPLSKEEACSVFSLDSTKPVVVVTGGSQGAYNMNTIVAEAAKLSGDFCQFLMITGPKDYERIRGLVSGQDHIKVIDFCSNMHAAYTAADFIISRSGASTLTEIAYFGVPSMLIPYPFAADDHQAHNAHVFSAQGAAIVMPQKELEPQRLREILYKTLHDQDTLDKMSRAALQNVVPHATEQITKIITQRD